MARMNDSPQIPAPAIDAGIAKAIALGLGLLLILGTAVLIVLLVTQKSEVDQAVPTRIELQAGEKVITVTTLEGQALFLVENASGEQRVLVWNLATGASSSVEIFSPNDRVTD